MWFENTSDKIEKKSLSDSIPNWLEQKVANKVWDEFSKNYETPNMSNIIELNAEFEWELKFSWNTVSILDDKINLNIPNNWNVEIFKKINSWSNASWNTFYISSWENLIQISKNDSKFYIVENWKIIYNQK